MKLNRRNLLLGTAATTLSTSVLAKSSEEIQPKIKWTCIASWPKDLNILLGGMIKIAERVSAMTDGAFQIDIVEDGEINPQISLLDAVSQGKAQCGHSASDYFSDRNVALNFFTSVPFGLTANEQLSWLIHGGGWKLAQEMYDPYGIVYFPAGNTGPQMGGWFKKEILSSEDLQGLKMRVVGLSAEVMKKMGVIPTSVPYLQIAAALKDGRLDAAEFVGPADDLTLGLDQAAPYYYAPGWWQIGDQLDFYVNREAFAALPSAYQEILASAAMEANVSVLAEYDSKNAIALEKIRDAGKVKLKEFPAEMLTTAYKLMQEIHAEHADSSADYKKVYESWSVFHRRSEFWRIYIGKTMMNFQR